MADIYLTPEEFKKKFGENPFDNTGIAGDFSSTPGPDIEEKPSYLKQVVNDARGIGSSLKNTFGKAQQKIGTINQAQQAGQQGTIESKFQKFGTRAGAISQGIGDVFMGGAKALAPQGVEDAASSAFKAVATPIAQSSPIQAIAERYNALDDKKKRDVDAALGIGSLMTDFLSFGVGKVGAKAGEAVAETAGKIATAPIRGAAKVGGKVAAESLGLTTGSGSEVIEQAFKSASPELKAAMRGKIPKEDIVDMFKGSLNKLKAQRGAEYQTQLQMIGEGGKSLDISPVYKSLEKQLKDFDIRVGDAGTYDFGRSVIQSPTEQSSIKRILDTLKEWGTEAGDRTPLGVDKLKKIVDNFIPESGAGRKFAAEVKNDIRDVLEKQVPNYKAMTSRYAETSGLIEEIERSLGLGGRGGVETAINKITQSLGENKEYRRSLVTELEKVGGMALKDQVAGASLSTWLPRGIVSRLFGGGLIGASSGALANIITGIAFALPTFSPRVVGELLVGLGLARKRIAPAIKAIEIIRNKVGQGAGAVVGAGAIPVTKNAIQNE